MRPLGSYRPRIVTKMPNFASQMRVALLSIALNTGSSSPGVELITLSTSDVPSAAATLRSCEQPDVLNGDDSGRRNSLAAPLLVDERPHLLSVDYDRADQFVSYASAR